MPSGKYMSAVMSDWLAALEDHDELVFLSLGL